MRRLSRNELQAIADRVITAYKKLPENQGKVLLKVEPEKLLKNLLGLNIDYKHLSRDGSILGLTSYADTEIQIYDEGEDDTYFIDDQTILIEKDLTLTKEQTGRKNFTLMHEGGHQILKMLFPHDYGVHLREAPVHYYRPGYERTKQVRDFGEWQANTLASLTLLPEECITRCLFLFGFNEKIHMLNKLYATWQYDRFCDMATFLGVSRSALHIRLKELGLIEHDYYDNPYALFDIRKDD